MSTTARYRIGSIDILRGIIMIIMALDHTRDFFHATAITADPLAPTTTTVPLFFTRWITHFCAPTFVFLSGLSAYLSSQNKTPGEASLFLIKRGLWLILAEITIVTLGISFNPTFNFIIFQVIWAIGGSMVILGILSRISYKLVFVVGVILFFGHDLLNYVDLPKTGFAANAWRILFTAFASIIPLSSTHFLGFFYALLPWTGVMLIGFSVGHWFHRNYSIEKRRRNLVITGLATIFLFILLRFINQYGDPAPRREDLQGIPAFLSFLNTSKYPPSLQYLCMTLGPSLLMLALIEQAKGRWMEVAAVYGRVPFFYYILHFYILHTLLVIVFFATGHGADQIVTPPFFFRPANFGYPLWIVYLIWLSVVAVLYLPCRWYGNYKRENRQWWLSYV